MHCHSMKDLDQIPINPAFGDAGKERISLAARREGDRLHYLWPWVEPESITCDGGRIGFRMDCDAGSHTLLDGNWAPFRVPTRLPGARSADSSQRNQGARSLKEALGDTRAAFKHPEKFRGSQSGKKKTLLFETSACSRQHIILCFGQYKTSNADWRGGEPR